MIADVIFKDLLTNTDERGYLREIIRVTDTFFTEGFGQWSHSMMYTGVVKAWHYHLEQIDWWYVASGVLKVALHDLRKDSLTYRQTMDFLMGDHQAVKVVRIPTGVAHGCKAVSGPVHLFYVTSKIYNPQDEGRIAHDDPMIGYDWLKEPDIK
jgi:dTDP-4-dehydrorhamnose 3,5-epimerase